MANWECLGTTTRLILGYPISHARKHGIVFAC